MQDGGGIGSLFRYSDGALLHSYRVRSIRLSRFHDDAMVTLRFFTREVWARLRGTDGRLHLLPLSQSVICR